MWVVLCTSVLHRGQLGSGYLMGLMVLRYDSKKGDLLQRSWDSVVLVLRSSVDSDGSIGGGSSFRILLGCLFVR